MARQLRLNLNAPVDFSREAFVAGASNAEAVERLDAWPDGAGAALALIGPAGSGKSHLAAIWAERVGAVRIAARAGIAALSDLGEAPVLLEDADGRADELLFHALNLASQGGGALLLTSRQAPREWPTTLPDLRSRLMALPTVSLDRHDDVMLRAVLDKALRERLLNPSEDIFPYVINRMERSVPAMLELAARLDEASNATGRRVSKALARGVLDAIEQPELLADPSARDDNG